MVFINLRQKWRRNSNFSKTLLTFYVIPSLKSLWMSYLSLLAYTRLQLEWKMIGRQDNLVDLARGLADGSLGFSDSFLLPVFLIDAVTFRLRRP